MRLGNGEESKPLLWASMNHNASYVDSLDGMVWISLRRSPKKTSVAYLIHKACWLMLSCRVADKSSDVTPTMIARVLYYTLQCTPTGKNDMVLARHEYGGASSFRLAATAVEYEQSLPRDLGFLLADPTESPKQRVEPSALKSLHFHPPPVLRSIKSSFREDRLSRLPPELIGQILVRLQSEDVCNLRLASRDAACASFPDNLPQEFWKSRFGQDMEMGFLYAHRNPDVLDAVTDWRGLYGFLQVSLRDATLDRGLRNKRRIWMCVGHTCESLVSLLNDERRNWRAWWTPIRGPQLESKWTGPFVQSPSSLLSSNQKLLLPVLSAIQSPSRVSVSFIPFNCKNYVCGLRVRRRPDCSEVISEVGIRLPATEEHFDIDDGDTMESLLVCSAVDGIVGLEFRFRLNDNSTSVSHRLGCCSTSNDVAMASLDASSSSTIHGMIFGFDVRRTLG